MSDERKSNREILEEARRRGGLSDGGVNALGPQELLGQFDDRPPAETAPLGGCFGFPPSAAARWCDRRTVATIRYAPADHPDWRACAEHGKSIEERGSDGITVVWDSQRPGGKK